MFNEIIKKVCDLANDYILTPFDLVNNARLDNYDYVKYYSKNDFLICEMKFSVLLEQYIFYYYFDSENKLQQIYAKNGKTKKLYFDRKKVVNQGIETYNKLIRKYQVS